MYENVLCTSVVVFLIPAGDLANYDIKNGKPETLVQYPKNIHIQGKFILF